MVEYHPVTAKDWSGDQDLRTSTLIRHRPIRGENHLDFLGESEWSLPPPHDSFLDAGEAINDCWSMEGNFINRHHVEPRVELHSPRDESFHFPLKYINISRTTHTGSRDLSDPWTGFTQFTLLEEKPPNGYMWSWGDINEKTAYIQARSFTARNLENNGKNAKLKEKQKWSNEKAPSGKRTKIARDLFH